MSRSRALLLALVAALAAPALPAAAQQTATTPPAPPAGDSVIDLSNLFSVAPGSAGAVASAPGGAVLRGLDKLTGAVSDLVLRPGDAVQFGRLEITLDECRFPVNNPASDAFARLTIRDTRAEGAAFAGWMLASSPALNPLDHPRYDVWVLRCNRS